MSRCIARLSGLFLAAMAASCGGGEEAPVQDSGGSTALAAHFVPAAASPGNGTVALAESAATGNLVTLRLDVRGVNDVYGGGFDLTFDPAHVEYVGWAPGDLLETGGQVPIYTVTPLAGKVVVGATRSGPVPGVDVVARRSLVRLTFRVTSAGSSAAALERASLLDAGPPAPQPIGGLTWFAGQFTAN